MLTRTKLLGICCALGMSFAMTPAMAEAPMGLAGTLQGDYSNLSLSNCSGCSNLDTWGGSGQGAFGLGMSDLGAQLGGGYHHSSGGGGNFNIWNVGGDLFWAPPAGRLGASVAYNEVTCSGCGSINFTSYGAFGEFYVSDTFTLAAKGGGISANQGSSGGYVGGMATFYFIPDLALSGGVDYADSGGSVTDISAQAEWLISEDSPVSIFGGYRYTDISGASSHGNTFFVGIKLYMGTMGPLVNRQRTGTLGWLSNTSLNVLGGLL